MITLQKEGHHLYQYKIVQPINELTINFDQAHFSNNRIIHSHLHHTIHIEFTDGNNFDRFVFLNSIFLLK